MPSPDSIYAAKLQALNEAQDALEKLTDQIKTLSQLTFHWDWLILPEDAEHQSEPQAFSQSVLHILSPDDWVTYDAFLEALRAWKTAQLAAMEASDAVDPDEVEPLPLTPWQRQEQQQRSALRRKLAAERAKKRPRRR